MTRRPAWGALLLAPALLLLAGCGARGTITVVGDEALIDLRVRYSGAEISGSHPCGDTPWWPNVAVLDAEVTDGTWSCRLTGSLASTDLVLTHAEGRYHLVLPGMYGSEREPDHDIDVRVRFPGPVIATTGQTWGDNTVRITDLKAHATVAADGPALTPRLAAGGLGLLAGVGVGVVASATLVPRVRRLRGRLAELDADTADTDDDAVGSRPESAPASAVTPPAGEDPSVWSPSGAPADPPR